MIRRGFLGLSMGLAVGLALAPGSRLAFAADPGNTLVIQVAGQAHGTVEIALRPDLAPRHVAQIKALAGQGSYDNVAFHRVIEGFMAQTGDVQFGTKAAFGGGQAGMGGSTMPDVPAEFTNTPFVRGTVGMARSQDPNSANSQFFIMFAPAPNLDGQYTVVGEVTSGMEVVDEIARGDGANGSVANPDYMAKVTLR